ncbi:MAG: 50S ribosomal protein L17 [Planctomycetes bacterium]|nr:50S ribosomal protein L17 [Planctomycetota bacterium]
MRHRKASNHFGRTKEHRAAMVRNLVLNLLRHERIRTTVQKAKAARSLAEKVITWSKKGDLHSRRLALKALGGNKPAVQKAFSRLAKRYADRQGGYTRIVKLPETIRLTKEDSLGRRRNMYGTRLGDNAQMVFLELVDTLPIAEAKGGKSAAGEE